MPYLRFMPLLFQAGAGPFVPSLNFVFPFLQKREKTKRHLPRPNREFNTKLRYVNVKYVTIF